MSKKEKKSLLLTCEKCKYRWILVTAKDRKLFECSQCGTTQKEK